MCKTKDHVVVFHVQEIPKLGAAPYPCKSLLPKRSEIYHLIQYSQGSTIISRLHFSQFASNKYALQSHLCMCTKEPSFQEFKTFLCILCSWKNMQSIFGHISHIQTGKYTKAAINPITKLVIKILKCKQSYCLRTGWTTPLTYVAHCIDCQGL